MALNTEYVQSVTLLSNASATGSSVTVKGGKYTWALEGTIGGTTATLQIACANGTNVNYPNASLTANGFVVVELPANASARVALTGGTPSAIYSTLVAIP